MSQLSLEDICLSFCRDTALEILALRKQGGGFLPCLTTKILRIYSSRFNWNINTISRNTADPCVLLPELHTRFGAFCFERVSKAAGNRGSALSGTNSIIA